jgi:hypothetical protein
MGRSLPALPRASQHQVPLLAQRPPDPEDATWVLGTLAQITRPTTPSTRRPARIGHVWGSRGRRRDRRIYVADVTTLPFWHGYATVDLWVTSRTTQVSGTASALSHRSRAVIDVGRLCYAPVSAGRRAGTR